MSHFTVAVFSDGRKTVEQLLAPYQENNMGDCPKAYLEFNNVEEKLKAEYENETDANGVPFKEVYPSLTAFIENYYEYEKDPEMGHYGYWENPNAKWDWWTIGGRYTGWYEKVEGKVKDFDFTPDKKQYKEAIRFWEIVVEDQPLNDGETKPFTIYKPEYYMERYHDKETYARISASFITYAVITPDGVWHQEGQMGWFGLSSETHEEAQDWDNNYKARFIDTADPEWTLTIVDCHI